jgi:8-oxo-dGTP diphosphatase
METRFSILVGVIPVYKNRILITQRSLKSKFLPGIWGLPCGKIEYDENLEDAVFRELYEETGLKGRIISSVGSSKFVGKKDDTYIHNTQINFIVETFNDEVILDSSSENFKWIKYSELHETGLDDFTTNTIIQSCTYFEGRYVETPFLHDLIAELDNLNWENLPQTFEQIPKLLKDFSPRIDEFRKSISSFPVNKFSRIIALSHDLPSHYKWFLYKSPLHNYSIWINEYKKDRQYGYANTIHNHRYWFASLLLKGYFHQAFHKAEGWNGKEFNSIPVVDELHTGSGDVYALSPEIIHSFPKIEDETVTLLIRSKALYDYSTSFNNNTKKSTNHYSFKTKLPHFQNIGK